MPKGQTPFLKGISHDPISATIFLSGNVTVNDLINAIQSQDEKIQTYEVKNSKGTAKPGADRLIESDKLIVTAENGLSKRIYTIEFPIIIEELKQGKLGQFTIKVKNTTVEELQNQLLLEGFYADHMRVEEMSFKVEQAKVRMEQLRQISIMFVIRKCEKGCFILFSRKR